jgi:hypothetical protein
MSSSRKIDLYRDFAAGVYLSEGPEPHTPPPQTYSHREGGEGGELNQRVGKKGNSSQSWVENNNMTDCISSL